MLRRLILLLAVTSAMAPRASAQAPDAEPYVPAGHWSREALRRLAGAGLVDAGGAVPAWPLPRARVRALLAGAAEAADQRASAELAALARGYLTRFVEELPAPERAGLWLGGRAGVGWTGRKGLLRGGAARWVEGVGWVYGGPERRPDGSGALMEAAFDVALPGPWAATASMRRGHDATRLDEAYLAATLGSVGMWAGRRPLGLGPTGGSGIVLSERVAFDGVGVELARGPRLPGFMRAAGPVHAALMVARMERSGPYRAPWFSAMRVGVSPRPSLTIGLNRATLFGGEGNQAVTPRRVALMLIGFTDNSPAKDSDFENQVASGDFFWRTRPFGLPLSIWGEWGFEDMGHAWTHVPGVVAGAELAAVPGLPAVALGVEAAWFDRSCCGNPPWYHHGPLAEGWTDRGLLLGHPLGGHGTERALLWRLDRPAAGLLAGGRIFRRDRGDENLLAPEQAGASVGGSLRLAAYGTRRARLRAEAEAEWGEAGWWGRAARVSVDVTF